MLGNPTVVLQHAAEGGGPLTDVRRAPTAQQIAGLGDGWYLNLEGRALGDTCVYARAFKKLIEEGKAPAVTYAHIAREEGHSGFALQYWFFWYFNQFNDLHEGDWEGMQITFEATRPGGGAARRTGAKSSSSSTPAASARTGKTARCRRKGRTRSSTRRPARTRPSTTPPSTSRTASTAPASAATTPPDRCANCSRPPILMPEGVVSTGPFAWTSYYGRWGEREKGFNNGPTGPQTKTQWREPFAWMAKQRTTSPRLPGGTIAGPQVTKAFCGAVATASRTDQPRRRIAARGGGDGDRRSRCS